MSSTDQNPNALTELVALHAMLVHTQNCARDLGEFELADAIKRLCDSYLPEANWAQHLKRNN